MIACPPDSDDVLAQRRAAIADGFTLEEAQALIRVLYNKALEGNLTAAKMVLPYILGKPSPKPKTAPPEETPPAPVEKPAPVAAARVVEPRPNVKPPAASSFTFAEGKPDVSEIRVVNAPIGGKCLTHDGAASRMGKT